MQLLITDSESLMEACFRLGDARFSLPNAVFDEAAGVWRGPFLREEFDEPALTSKREGRVFAKTTYPLYEAILELRGVKACSISDRSHIELYYFRFCEPVGDAVRLVFAEDMEITLTFDGAPRGGLADVRLSEQVGTSWGLKGFA